MTEPSLDLNAEWVEEVLEITWDPNHPLALAWGINDWTEKEWLDCLLRGAERVLAQAESEGTPEP